MWPIAGLFTDRFAWWQAAEPFKFAMNHGPHLLDQCIAANVRLLLSTFKGVGNYSFSKQTCHTQQTCCSLKLYSECCGDYYNTLILQQAPKVKIAWVQIQPT